MKLKYLFTLPILAAAFIGCDEIEYSDAKPVENPQLPGITENDFVVTPSAQLQNGIDFKNFLNDAENAEDTGEPLALDLFTVTATTENLPGGAVIGAQFQISEDADFSNPQVIPVTNNGEGVFFATLPELLKVYQQMYGDDPATQTLYYRIPVTITVDGGTYRLGNPDYFYCNANTFQETGPEVTYTIESTYYIIGATGWDISNCVALENSGNPYKDPNFTYSITTYEGFWWKIVPGSVYESAKAAGELTDDNFWGLLYGTATDGDTALEGDLININAQSGHILPGKWTMTFNMKENTYTITGSEFTDEPAPWKQTGIFLRGDMTDEWSPLATYEFLYEQDYTSNIIVAPYIVIASGNQFKIADANWASVNYGGSGSPIFGQPMQLVYNGENLYMDQNFCGWVELNQNNETATFNAFGSQSAGTSTGIFLKGGMNDWSDNPAYEFVTTEYQGVYTLANVNIPAGIEFKIADSSWSNPNLGKGLEVAFNAPYRLNNGSNDNMIADEPFTGSITLVNNSTLGEWFMYMITE